MSFASTTPTVMTGGAYNTGYVMMTPGGGNYSIIGTSIDNSPDVKPSDIKRNVSLRLYFSYVKSKFTKLERQRIAAATRRYSSLRVETKETGQRGLYEQVSELLLVAVREQECLACGFDTAILRADVERFKDKVDSTVRLDPIENFPRVIPKAPAAKLKLARDRKLFDKFSILYHPAQAEAPIKTMAEKIRKKDPILFGEFSHSPSKLYVVADWVDEHCDLTVDKLVAQLRDHHDKDYLPEKLHVPTKADVAALKAEILTRNKLLVDANQSNWRAHESQALKDQDVKPKTGWLQRAARWWNW